MKKSLRKSGATINVEVVDTVVSTGTVASTSMIDSSSTGFSVGGKVVTRIGVGESGGSTGTNTNRTTRNKSTWSKINRRRIVCCDTGEVFYSYRKYLLSRHWLLFKKRFRSSKYYRGCCYICSSSYKNHLHHISYERIGCELFSDVVELCSFPCHVNVHRAMKKGVSWDDVVRNLEVAVLSLVCYNVYMEIIMI